MRRDSYHSQASRTSLSAFGRMMTRQLTSSSAYGVSLQLPPRSNQLEDSAEIPRVLDQACARRFRGVHPASAWATHLKSRLCSWLESRFVNAYWQGGLSVARPNS